MLFHLNRVLTIQISVLFHQNKVLFHQNRVLFHQTGYYFNEAGYYFIQFSPTHSVPYPDWMIGYLVCWVQAGHSTRGGPDLSSPFTFCWIAMKLVLTGRLKILNLKLEQCWISLSALRSPYMISIVLLAPAPFQPSCCLPSYFSNDSILTGPDQAELDQIV